MDQRRQQIFQRLQQELQYRQQLRSQGASQQKPKKTSDDFPWTSAFQVRANQQCSVTTEQRRMLSRFPSLWPVSLLLWFTFITFALSLGVASTLGMQQFVFVFLLPLVLSLFTLIFLYSKRISVLRAADTGQISCEQGEVVWRKNRYVIHMPNRRLRTVASELNLPPPGPYHFYYLTGSRILLSAQPIHINTSELAYPGLLAETGLSGREQARLALQQALYSGLNFDQFDLECNRMGMLSLAQRHRLSRKLFRSVIASFIVVSIFLPIAVNIVITMKEGDAGLFFLLGFIVLLLLPALYHLTIGARRQYAEIQRMAVSFLEDVVQGREVSGGADSADEYYFDVGNLSFKVGYNAYKALISGIRYRVYYLPKMRAITSIEPIELPVH